MRNIFFVLFLSSYSLLAQNSSTASINSATADSLHQLGDIKGAINIFKLMYQRDGADFNGFYNYACVLSADGQVDSAFKYLYIACTHDTSPNAFCDADFFTLRKDRRWNDFETYLISSLQKKSNNAIRDIEYAKKLWLMLANDQAYYDCIKTAQIKIGMNSTVVKALWDLKKRINDDNQKELEQMVEAKGWPKKSQVGEYAATAAFLVIQHSDAERQRKYLPAIKKLCEEQEARWSNYALMYDRVETSENKPQKYGSQLRFNDQTQKYELFPLLDETKVDEWRKEVGLGPLADYVASWHIKFEPQKK